MAFGEFVTFSPSITTIIMRTLLFVNAKKLAYHSGKGYETCRKVIQKAKEAHKLKRTDEITWQELKPHVPFRTVGLP